MRVLVARPKVDAMLSHKAHNMATNRNAAPAPDRLLTTKEACERYGLGRTAWWERGRRDPAFPKPRYIGARSPRWSVNEIESYIAERTAARALRQAGAGDKSRRGAK
jgi:predicted DNA-binding transcriptional regulator AlpA